MPGVSQAQTQLLVVEEALERPCGRLRALLRHPPRGLAGTGEGVDAAAIGGHHRRPASHRLERRQPPAFEMGRQQEDRDFVVEAPQCRVVGARQVADHRRPQAERHGLDRGIAESPELHAPALPAQDLDRQEGIVRSFERFAAEGEADQGPATAFRRDVEPEGRRVDRRLRGGGDRQAQVGEQRGHRRRGSDAQKRAGEGLGDPPALAFRGRPIVLEVHRVEDLAAFFRGQSGDRLGGLPGAGNDAIGIRQVGLAQIGHETQLDPVAEAKPRHRRSAAQSNPAFPGERLEAIHEAAGRRQPAGVNHYHPVAAAGQAVGQLVNRLEAAARILEMFRQYEHDTHPDPLDPRRRDARNASIVRRNMRRSIKLWRSWRDLAQRGAGELPAGVELISVDLFDSLILRRLDSALLLEGVDRELLRQLKNLGRQPLVAPAAARYEVFTELGARNAGRGLDFAASLREVAPRWLERVAGGGLPEDLAGLIESFEAALETRWSYANPPLLEWLRQMGERGLRLVFCSDMYLAQAHLEAQLARLGCGGLFAAGYVSSEEGVLKKTGRLFQRLAEREGVPPGRILHLGDVREADGERAAEAGLSAWVIEDRGEARRRRRLARDARLLRSSPVWIGPLAGEAAGGEAAVREPTAGERLGAEVLGPAISAFVHAVAEQCREQGVRRVFFLAREGYVLQRVFETLRPVVWPGGGGPAAVYLGVSRLTTFLAGARQVGLRQLSAVLMNHPWPTLRRVLEPFQLDPALVAELAERYGFADLDARLPDYFRDWAPFQRLLEDPGLEAAVRGAHEGHHRRLRDYLRQEGFFGGGAVALVDLGWSGQIQDNLVQAFGREPDFPRLCGLYLGIRRQAHGYAGPRSGFAGLLIHEAGGDWHGAAGFFFVQAFETLLRAPHGTVVGYTGGELGGETVQPLLRPENEEARRRERADDAIAVQVQKGLLRHAERYADLAQIAGAGAADARPWALSCLDRCFRYPEPDEARLLFSFVNVCDLGMAEVVPLGPAPAQPSRGLSLRRQLAASFWKAGTFTLAAGRWLRHAGIVWLAVRAAPPKGQGAHDAPTPAGGSWPDPPEDSRLLAAQPFPSGVSRFEAFATERFEAVGQTSPGEITEKGRPRGPATAYFLGSWLDLALTRCLCRLTGRRPWRSSGFPPRLWLERVLSQR